MKKTYFITGTDTDVGKTLVASTLLYKAAQRDIICCGLKPVAAGCEAAVMGDASTLRNDDALQLQQYASLQLPYAAINPIALPEAIAPHIAARRAGLAMDVAGLCLKSAPVLESAADFIIVEGAGGWLVPLNTDETLADFAVAIGAEVILVVALRLGCLNHALLSAAAIAHSGLRLAGWVATQTQAQLMPQVDENIATLTARLAAPCLGVLPYLQNPHPVVAENHLEIVPLL